MGNTDSRAKFQQCLARLSDPAQELSLTEEAVLDGLCQDQAVSSASQVFALLQPRDVRRLRDSAPGNLRALCVKVSLSLTLALPSLS